MRKKLAKGDIEDSLSQLYPAGPCAIKPDVNFDPGRIRSDALMMQLYGQSANEVKASLVPVEWFGTVLRVTKRQGAAAALEKVRDALKTMPELKAFLTPSAGTFNWRRVAGASNMSVHSFGAAIDLNTQYADYWIWAGGKPGRVAQYRNQYPMEIVNVFERHGFIWGGRWYHYDTMHFEYRPELIAIGKAAGVAACRVALKELAIASPSTCGRSASSCRYPSSCPLRTGSFCCGRHSWRSRARYRTCCKGRSGRRHAMPGRRRRRA